MVFLLRLFFNVMNTIFSEKSLRNEIYLKQNSIRSKRSSQDLLIKNLKALLARMERKLTQYGSSILIIDVEQMFDGFLASFVFQCNKYNILGKKAYEMKYI